MGDYLLSETDSGYILQRLDDGTSVLISPSHQVVAIPWEDLRKLVINMGFQLLAASARVEPAGEEE